MTNVIGLTGGIGSGKSTIARFFADLGVPVYYADDAAREVMRTPQMISAIAAAFGQEMVVEGQIDRKKLASMVFSDPDRLEMLNRTVHPSVKVHFEEWLLQHQNYGFVIREAAILFESGSYKDCKKIITVTAPFETKIQRVMQRDNVSREHVISRMDNQWPDEKKMGLSDYVIHNVDLDTSREEVAKIFKSLKKL